VLNADVGSTLQEFIEEGEIPYIDTADSRGFVTGDHPLHVNAARSKAMGEADLVVLVGKRLDFSLAFGSDVLFADEVSFLQIDADGGEIGRNRPIEVPVIGDERSALESLTDRLADGRDLDRDEEWVRTIQEIDDTQRAALEDRMWVDDEPIHPWRLCAEVRDRVEPGAYVGCDGGDILSFGRIALDVDAPGHWMSSGPFGCLGSTVAFTATAALLEPDEQAICLIGDGSFGFDGMELDTVARYDLDVTYVVANNAAWNIDRYDQVERYDNVVGTELQATRYDKLAEAVGGHGEHVESVEELGPALDRAIDFAGPSVIDVRVRADVPSPDYQQGMQAHENLDLPDLQILQPWDAAERAKRNHE
jgi:acetolactate synthase-1/2/3 large subunit